MIRTEQQYEDTDRTQDHAFITLHLVRSSGRSPLHLAETFFAVANPLRRLT